MDIVIPDQFVDRTRGRSRHSSAKAWSRTSASPILSAVAGRVLAGAGETAGVRIHSGGTYLCMEGPAFSTLAESRLYRSWGMT